MSRDASFLSLPCDTVASLIGSDELPVQEPDVVSAVRSWFEHDAAGRTGALKTLVPLVRWPLLPVEVQKALHAEPLLKQLMALDNGVELGIKMLLECNSELRERGCPRLKRRKGTPQPVPTLLFDAFSESYRTSVQGALVESIKRITDDRVAMCKGQCAS